MPFPKTKVVYLVMEIARREALALEYIACQLANRGKFSHVYIVELRAFLKMAMFGQLVPGVVLLKSAPDHTSHIVKKLKKAGFAICVQNQEGLSMLPSEAASGWQICSESIDDIDYVFSAGKEEYDKFQERMPSGKVLRSETIRLQLPIEFLEKSLKEETSTIKDVYGEEIILFVSTLGDFCHGVDSIDRLEYGVRASELLAETAPTLAHEYLVWSKSQQHTLYALCDLVSRFRNRKECLVIRPHPSDNVNFLRYLFANLENVRVCDDFSIVPWLLASKAVVCSTSTVAMEAKALGKRPICLLPEIGPEGDFLKELEVNRIGIMAKNAEEIEKILGEPNSRTEYLIDETRKQEIIDDFLNVIEGLAFHSYGNHNRMRYVLFIVSKLIKLRKFVYPQRESYFNRKFPGFITIYDPEKLRKFDWFCDRAVVFQTPNKNSNFKET